MGEHVDEVEYHHIEWCLQALELLGNLLAEVAFVDLEIGVGVAFAETVKLGLNEVFLVVVLALLLVPRR